MTDRPVASPHAGSIIDALEREGLAGRSAGLEGELEARGALPEGRARAWLAACCAVAELVGGELQQMEAAAMLAYQQRLRARAATGAPDNNSSGSDTAAAAVVRA